jgi:hypothetical protein
MKRVMEDLAKTERRSLSSLVVNILYDYLAKNQIEWERPERRGHERKVINMPAQFRVLGKQIPEVHDVFIKDISQAGAYTISTDIVDIENILKNDGISAKARLIINSPNFEEPIDLNCKVVRISIDRSLDRNLVGIGLVGIGLEYRKIGAREQSVINETLLTGSL